MNAKEKHCWTAGGGQYADMNYLSLMLPRKSTSVFMWEQGNVGVLVEDGSKVSRGIGGLTCNAGDREVNGTIK